MGRSTNGLGPKPGKKRATIKTPGILTEGTAVHDAAAARRDAKALLQLSSKSPAAGGAAGKRASPSTAAVPNRYFREKVKTLEADLADSNRLKNSANSRARAAEEREVRAKTLAANRLSDRQAAQDSERAWREQLLEAEDEKAELGQSAAGLRVIGRQSRGEGGGSGQRPWPLWMVQLILEKLVLGVPPEAIPDDIIVQDRMTTGRTGQEVPSADFCRDMRIVLRVLTETLAAYQLALQEQWHQLFTDGTGRRQIALETILIALENDAGELKPLILSAAHVLQGESSEQTCAAVLKQIVSGGARLGRWVEVHERDHPDDEHDIPDVSEMNAGKLGGGAASTDTAAAARKSRRLLCEAIAKAAADWHELDPLVDFADQRLHCLEVDCYNHLRNVWLGGMAKALTARLKEELHDQLEAIDWRLRVSTSMESVLRALDKEFSLNANYAKGHGQLFFEWIRCNHPGELLLHVERASGSRQDLAVEGAGALYFNRIYYIEFLDERLRTCGAEGNILQENLFIILSSVEMIAQARVCSIVHLCICLPMRWLAGNSHLLSEYGWSVRSNGRAIDLLEKALEAIEADGYIFLDEEFMFGIFWELMEELPPFKDYLTHMYESKTMAAVGSSSNDKVPLDALWAELFNPESETNQETEEKTVELAAVAASALLEELRDESKATAEHLSSAAGRFCWELTTEEDHEQGLGKYVVNDPAESSFGGLTRELQCFGRIALRSAGAVAQCRWNGDLKRQRPAHGKARTAASEDGIFHRLSAKMQQSLLTMCMEDKETTRAADRAALDAQRAEKRRKEELARKAAMAKGQEAFIDALYYREMYDSAACWKTPAIVDRELVKLISKSAQLQALKENIRMRVLGFGWADLATAWSKDGKEFSVAQLTAHLKTIIVATASRDIPSKPPLPLPARKALPVLGEQARDAAALDLLQLSKGAEFEAEARRVRAEREAEGVGDSCAERQQQTAPLVDKALLGKRLEICCNYELDNGGSEPRWCAGQVILVSDGRNIAKGPRSFYKEGEAVMMRWDAAPDRKSMAYPQGEPVSESAARLLKSMWNPRGVQRDGGWRFDL